MTVSELTPARTPDRPGDPSGSGRGKGPGPSRFSRRHRPGHVPIPVVLLWLGPALALIFGVVLFPAYELVRASLSDYSITGLKLGSAGLDNYQAVLEHPSLGVVLKNTVIWVVCGVGLTMLIGLALAQFMAKEFAGRKLMRWAIIVPWAASLVITARLFTLILDYNHGILNRLLQVLHLINEPIDFLGDDRFTMARWSASGCSSPCRSPLTCCWPV